MKSNIVFRIITLAIVALTFVFSTIVANAQEPPINRFWGQFPIAGAQLRTKPIDGGAGGNLGTRRVSIYAQAVAKVQEGQRFEWEWIGLTAPGFSELLDFPNVEFTFNSDESREYRNLSFDLNPISPNIWGSNETVSLEYDFIGVSGTYKSFSHESSFSTKLLSSGNLASPFAFNVKVAQLDYSRFNERLQVLITGTPQHIKLRPERYFDIPRQEIVLEPKLALDGLDLWKFPQVDSNGVPMHSGTIGAQRFTLKHTPTGDANNDGTVGFDDFLILSSGFGAQAAAWEDGDFTFDGVVGFDDFLGLSANFGRFNAAVPEPSSLLLFLLGILSIRWFHRK